MNQCHYQLSNRLAFLWRLAKADIPTVLVYLGCTGDQPFGTGVVPFRDHECGGHANVNGDYTDREQGLQRIVNSASARS